MAIINPPDIPPPTREWQLVAQFDSVQEALTSGLNLGPGYYWRVEIYLRRLPVIGDQLLALAQATVSAIADVLQRLGLPESKYLVTWNNTADGAIIKVFIDNVDPIQLLEVAAIIGAIAALIFALVAGIHVFRTTSPTVAISEGINAAIESLVRTGALDKITRNVAETSQLLPFFLIGLLIVMAMRGR
jgi:hypothetical protein